MLHHCPLLFSLVLELSPIKCKVKLRTISVSKGKHMMQQSNNIEHFWNITTFHMQMLVKGSKANMNEVG